MSDDMMHVEEERLPEQTDNSPRPEDGDQSDVSQSPDVIYTDEVTDDGD